MEDDDDYNNDDDISPSNAEATFIQSTRTQRFFENSLNLVLLVFIGKLSLRALR